MSVAFPTEQKGQPEPSSETASGPHPVGEPLRRRVSHPLTVGLLSFVLLLLWLVPARFSLTERLLGHPSSDLIKHYWNLWWFRAQVQAGELPFATTLLNFPRGLELYPIEPLNGLLALVWVPLVGLAGASNVLALLNIGLAWLGMGLLVWQLTGRKWAAWCAGALFSLSSYPVWTVYVGVGELTQLGLVPLALYALLKLVAEGTPKRWLLAVLGVFLAVFSCWYHMLFLGMAVACWLVTQLPGSRQALRGWLRFAGAALLGALLVWPILSAFRASYQAGAGSTEPVLTYVQARLERMPHDPPHTRLDPAQLFWGGEQVRARARQTPYAGGRYLGLVLPLLGLVGWALRPREGLAWLLLVGVSGVLGLGSRLVMGGLEQGGPLPFLPLNLLLERLVQPMNFPARFMMPLTLGLCILVGLGLGRLEGLLCTPRRRMAWLGGWAVVGLGLLPLGELRLRGDLPLPLVSTPLPAEPAAEALRQDALARRAQGESVGGLLELPQLFQYNSRHAYDEVLRMQVIHGIATASLPLDRIDALVPSMRVALAEQPLLRALQGATDATPEALAAAGQALKAQGFDYLIMSWRELPASHHARVRALLGQLFPPPLYSDEWRSVYRLP